MEQGYISHRAAGNDCYAWNKDEVVINIKTGYDVKAVELCWGDPFSAGIMGGGEQWQGEPLAMKRECELAQGVLWSVTVKPEYKRCKYYFVLHDGVETLYFFEDGCCTKERMELKGRKLQYFFFPWMNPSDIAQTPEWVSDTVWYQIFPERFCNGDASRNPEHTKPWKCERTTYRDVYGGDIAGIRSKIPYLKELGITGIYLTPVFAAESNHKYNTTDYYRVDEAFGTEEDLKLMVEEAHAAGIRVMLDAVFNHAGTAFAPWQDVLEKGENSPYFDWFFINRLPVEQAHRSTKDGRYYSFAFAEQMPKLNTNNPDVQNYFKDLCSYWLREWGIDGIRFDVGNEIAHSFIKMLRIALKKINPEVYLLGEIWHDSLPWLYGDEYDSVMNYPFAQSINDFFVDGNMTAEDFAHDINRCYHLYYRQMNRVLFNLLDSHDTERLFTRVGSMGAFYQQLALLFTMEGSPCIYYGTEIAMEGGHDPDCRRCMPWEEIAEGCFDTVLENVKRLIAVRKQYAAAKSREIRWIKTENARVICYEKTDKNGTLTVILNVSEIPYQVMEDGERLFGYGYEQGVLESGGTLLLWRNEKEKNEK